MRRRRRTAVTAIATGALVAGAPAFVSSAYAHQRDDGRSHGYTSVRTVVDGLDGPRGLAEKHGRLVVAETDGTFSLIVARHHRKARLVRLGRVRTDFAPAVDIGPDGTVWILTGGGQLRTSAKLFKWRHGYHRPRPFANIGRYQAKDVDPYDTEGNPGDSNPFGVAALRDGSVLVADAGGNDLLRVSRHGKISTVARLKTRTIPMPPGFPSSIPGEDGGPPMDLPPAGTPIPSEGVATSVTVGPGGYWYVGELRGFPATPGTSQIWRIKPGTRNAVCDPEAPEAGRCTVYADGLTSIMDLGARGHDKDLYAVEFSTQSWAAVEILQKPGADVGALIKVSHHGKRLRELAPGKFHLPGGVAVDRRERVYVAGPVFGPGSVQVVKQRHRHRR